MTLTDYMAALVTALALVALKHPDPWTRATAERLLRLLFGREGGHMG